LCQLKLINIINNSFGCANELDNTPAEYISNGNQTRYVHVRLSLSVHVTATCIAVVDAVTRIVHFYSPRVATCIFSVFSYLLVNQDLT